MTTLSLECAHCGKFFEKRKKEYTRQIRKGREPTDFFCSRSCSTGAYMGRDRARYSSHLSPQHKNYFNLKGRFTYYLRKARQRQKELWDDSNLDEEYLSNLWENQNGKCAWTGADMVLISRGAVVDYFASASLDRICSDIGYVKGNVQFVLLPLNYAKGSADDGDFRHFLRSIQGSLRG